MGFRRGVLMIGLLQRASGTLREYTVIVGCKIWGFQGLYTNYVRVILRTVHVISWSEGVVQGKGRQCCSAPRGLLFVR